MSVIEPLEVPENEPSARSLARTMASPRTVISLTVAFGLLAFYLNRQDPATLLGSWQLIRASEPALYLGAIAMYYSGFLWRGARWRILLTNAGETRSSLPGLAGLCEIIYLSWFVNSVVPAKLGDLYRGWLLRRGSAVSWSRSMGTIVAERALDFLVLVLLMLLASGLTFGPALREAIGDDPRACFEQGLQAEVTSCTLLVVLLAGLAIFAAAAVGLVIFARFGGHIERFLAGRVQRIYTTFSGALLLSFNRFGALLALTVLAWLSEAGAVFLTSRAIGVPLPLPLVLVFSLLSAFITTIPVTPGGLGFEPILVGALLLSGRLAGDVEQDALALTLLYRSISYLSLVVGGAVVYALSPRTK